MTTISPAQPPSVPIPPELLEIIFAHYSLFESDPWTGFHNPPDRQKEVLMRDLSGLGKALFGAARDRLFNYIYISSHTRTSRLLSSLALTLTRPSRSNPAVTENVPNYLALLIRGIQIVIKQPGIPSVGDRTIAPAATGPNASQLDVLAKQLKNLSMLDLEIKMPEQFSPAIIKSLARFGNVEECEMSGIGVGWENCVALLTEWNRSGRKKLHSLKIKGFKPGWSVTVRDARETPNIRGDFNFAACLSTLVLWDGVLDDLSLESLLSTLNPAILRHLTLHRVLSSNPHSLTRLVPTLETLHFVTRGREAITDNRQRQALLDAGILKDGRIQGTMQVIGGGRTACIADGWIPFLGRQMRSLTLGGESCVSPNFFVMLGKRSWELFEEQQWSGGQVRMGLGIQEIRLNQCAWVGEKSKFSGVTVMGFGEALANGGVGRKEGGGAWAVNLERIQLKGMNREPPPLRPKSDSMRNNNTDSTASGDEEFGWDLAGVESLQAIINESIEQSKTMNDEQKIQMKEQLKIVDDNPPRQPNWVKRSRKDDERIASWPGKGDKSKSKGGGERSSKRKKK